MATTITPEGAKKRTNSFSILPELLIADIKQNGRAYDYSREECEDLLRDYANPAIGQLQAVSVVEVKGTDKYRVIYGNRRRAAMIFYNEDLAAAGKPPKVLDITVSTDLNEAEAYVRNIRENAGRKSLTPIDVAVIIRTMRADYNATDAEIAKLFPNTRKPGQYMSLAFVTQHAKLNSLPEDVKRRVHRGDIPADYAFKLADMTAKELKSVLNTAAEIEAGIEQEVLAGPEPVFAADPEAAEQPAEESPNGEVPPPDAAPEAPAKRKKAAPATPEQTEKAEELKKTGKLKGASVEQAIRNVAPDKAPSRKIKDVRSVFQMLIDSEESAGIPKPQVELAKGMIKFIDSKLSERQLQNLLDRVCKAK